MGVFKEVSLIVKTPSEDHNIGVKLLEKKMKKAVWTLDLERGHKILYTS